MQSVRTRTDWHGIDGVKPLMTNRPVTERDLACARLMVICVTLMMFAASACILAFA